MGLAQGTGAPAVGTTWNPADKGDFTVLSNGNLTAACGTEATVEPSSSVRTVDLIGDGEKKIWEYTFDSVTAGGDGWVGLGTTSASINDYPGHTNEGIGYASWGSVFHNNSVIASYSSWTVGDIITIEFDRDTATATFYKNGTLQGSVSPSMPSGSVSPMVSNANTQKVATYTANFAGPFQITPSSGYTPITP